MAGVAVYGIAAIAVARLEPGLGCAAMSAAFLIAAAIALSRVIMGAHWVADVIAGLALGFGMLALAHFALA